MVLPKKGSMVMKKKNIPTIVLSNLAPEENYSNSHALSKAAWITRFTVIECEDKINIL